MPICNDFFDYMCLECFEQTVCPGVKKAPEDRNGLPQESRRPRLDGTRGDRQKPPRAGRGRAASRSVCPPGPAQSESGTRRMAMTACPGSSKRGSTAWQGSGTVSSTQPGSACIQRTDTATSSARGHRGKPMSGNHPGRRLLPESGTSPARTPELPAGSPTPGKPGRFRPRRCRYGALTTPSRCPGVLNDDGFTLQRVSAGMALLPVPRLEMVTPDRRSIGGSGGILDPFSLTRNRLASNFPTQVRKLVSPPACRHATRISAALRRGTGPAFSRIAKPGKAGTRHGPYS